MAFGMLIALASTTGFSRGRQLRRFGHILRRRLANYEADHAVDYREVTPDALAERALAAMHAPVRYRPVETDGAARAARRIAEVLENRGRGG